MTTYHAGQEVEVRGTLCQANMNPKWRKAKIGARFNEHPSAKGPTFYEVTFPDGSSGMFDEQHIRAAEDEEKVKDEMLLSIHRHMRR